MKIVVASKVVFDDQDILVAQDGTLDFSKSRKVINSYDLNALEAGLQLKEQIEGCELCAVVIGGTDIDEPKIKKDVLSRGPDNLFMISDTEMDHCDTHMTAAAMAQLLKEVGAWDLLICGDGSADNYTQQVDIQTAELMGVPAINGVKTIAWTNGAFYLERTLEDTLQTLRVTPPCVVSVIPEIAKPHICGMKEILQAGKKPSKVFSLEELNCQVSPSIESLETLTPEAISRKSEIFDADEPGEVEKFIQAISSVLD